MHRLEMMSPQRKVLLPFLLAAGLFASGCAKSSDAQERTQPRAAPSSPDSIPAGPVTGKIHGKPFTLKAARYSLDIRPGHEQADTGSAS